MQPAVDAVEKTEKITSNPSLSTSCRTSSARRELDRIVVGRQKMRCGTRALSLTSLGFGLVATGALSLAVATDYWLFTVEPVAVKFDFNNDTIEAEAVYEEPDTASTAPSPDAVGLIPEVLVLSMHSGLWRLCFIIDPPGAYIALYS